MELGILLFSFNSEIYLTPDKISRYRLLLQLFSYILKFMNG